MLNVKLEENFNIFQELVKDICDFKESNFKSNISEDDIDIVMKTFTSKSLEKSIVMLFDLMNTNLTEEEQYVRLNVRENRNYYSGQTMRINDFNVLLNNLNKELSAEKENKLDYKDLVLICAKKFNTPYNDKNQQITKKKTI